MQQLLIFLKNSILYVNEWKDDMKQMWKIQIQIINLEIIDVLQNRKCNLIFQMHLLKNWIQFKRSSSDAYAMPAFRMMDVEMCS